MNARVVTLPFSSAIGGFDETPLRDAIADASVIALREHIVLVDGRPYVVCVVQTCAPSTTNTVFPTAGPRPAQTPVREATLAATTTTDIAATSPIDQPTTRDRTNPNLPPLDADQSRVYERLRSWRRSRAHADGVPPYVVLTNRQLDALVRLRPTSKARLAAIDGIGPAKLDRYARDVIEQDGLSSSSEGNVSRRRHARAITRYGALEPATRPSHSRNAVTP